MTKPIPRVHVEHMEWDYKGCGRFSTGEINWIALREKKKRLNHRSVGDALRVLYSAGEFLSLMS